MGGWKGGRGGWVGGWVVYLEEVDEGSSLVEAGGVDDNVLLDRAGDDPDGLVFEHLVEVLVKVFGLG